MKDDQYNKGKEKSKKRDSKHSIPEQPPALKTPYKPHGQAADLINFLQQTRGNQQVQQMIESGELHAMLRVSQANDPLEREADRVADMVMDSFSPDFDVDEYINNTFAASSAMRGKTVDDLFPNRVKGLGGGKALPQTERTFFEERFGADFSGVRVYTGPTADEFARSINARAFTYRQDIVFADGEYAPGTREGRRLMAHELTHVLQDKQDVVQRAELKKFPTNSIDIAAQYGRYTQKAKILKAYEYNGEFSAALKYDGSTEKLKVRSLGSSINTKSNSMGGNYISMFEVEKTGIGFGLDSYYLTYQNNPLKRLIIDYHSKHDSFILKFDTAYPYQVKLRNKIGNRIYFELVDISEDKQNFIEALLKRKESALPEEFDLFRRSPNAEHIFCENFQEYAVKEITNNLEKTIKIVDEEKQNYFGTSGSIDELVALIKEYGEKYNAADQLRADTFRRFAREEGLAAKVKQGGVNSAYPELETLVYIMQNPNNVYLTREIAKRDPQELFYQMVYYMFLTKFSGSNSKSFTGHYGITYNQPALEYVKRKYPEFDQALVSDAVTEKKLRTEESKKFKILTDIHTDFKAWSGYEPDEIKKKIKELLIERKQNAKDTIARLKAEPTLVWELKPVMPLLMNNLRITTEDVAGAAVMEKVKSVSIGNFVRSIGMAAAGIMLGILGFFTSGATWAVLVAGVSVSAYDLYLEVKDYNYHSGASAASFDMALSTKPSAMGIVFAILGLVLDVVDVVKYSAKLIRASAEAIDASSDVLKTSEKCYQQLVDKKIIKSDLVKQDDFVQEMVRAKNGVSKVDQASKAGKGSTLFEKYPVRIKWKTSGIDEQVKFLTENIPGLKTEQARLILQKAFDKESSVIIGGSRVRGNFSVGSDIDIGFGNLSSNQAKKLIEYINEIGNKNPSKGFLKLETTRIVPGNKTNVIDEIITPEEFFQRSGTRVPPDAKAGELYKASGSVTIKPDGGIEIIPAGGLK